MQNNSFTVFLLITFSIFNNVFSQTKTVEVATNKNDMVIEIIQRGNNDFFIETVTPKYEYKLLQYNSDLTKLWETPLELTDANFLTSASGLSDFVYITNNNLQLELDNKKIVTIDISRVPDGRLFKALFQDAKYAYTLYSVKFNKTYLLRRMEHISGNLKDITIDLPKPADYLYSSEWNYLTNDNSSIILYNKTTGYLNQNRFKNNVINYQIAVIDSTGAIKFTKDIDVNLENNFVYPSQNFRKEREYGNPIFDFEIKTIGSKNLFVPLPASYSSIIYDKKAKNILIYGLCGNTPFIEKDNKSVIESYFLYKYDLKGNPVTSQINNLPNDTSIYGGYDTKTFISFTPDNNVCFQVYFDRIKSKISAIGKIYSFVCSKDKLINQYIHYVPSHLKKLPDIYSFNYTTRAIQDFELLPIPEFRSDMIKFYNSLSGKEKGNNFYWVFRFDRNDVLIENNENKGKIIMYSFNK